MRLFWLSIVIEFTKSSPPPPWKVDHISCPEVSNLDMKISWELFSNDWSNPWVPFGVKSFDAVFPATMMSLLESTTTEAPVSLMLPLR